MLSGLWGLCRGGDRSERDINGDPSSGDICSTMGLGAPLSREHLFDYGVWVLQAKTSIRLRVCDRTFGVRAWFCLESQVAVGAKSSRSDDLESDEPQILCCAAISRDVLVNQV